MLIRDIPDKDYTFTLPAGRYVVGDPCYMVPTVSWSSFLQRMYDNGAQEDVPTEDQRVWKWEELDKVSNIMDEYRTLGDCICLNTLNGDGYYVLQSNNRCVTELIVDSGTLCIMPARCVEASVADVVTTCYVFKSHTKVKVTCNPRKGMKLEYDKKRLHIYFEE